MSTLRLPLKAVYFDQIKAGLKRFEYRLCTPYWEKRLVGKTYDRIVLTKGYPKADDAERHLVRKWLGCSRTTIRHEHFGPDPVNVFAIDVTEAL